MTGLLQYNLLTRIRLVSGFKSRFGPTQPLATDFSRVIDEPDSGYWKLENGVLTVMTAPERAVVDQARLDDMKRAKAEQIDRRTDELIALGFVYNGKQFSLSLEAQLTVQGLYASRSEPALYPIVYNTLDDLGAETLVDEAALAAFFAAARSALAAAMVSGTQLKAQIRAAADKAQLDAVEDTR